VPEAKPPDRLADHAQIGRLVDDLVPALMAKLSATHLGEIEVREGDWRIRLRRPASSEAREGRRATDRPSRIQPGHEGHAHPRGALEGSRPPRVVLPAGYADATVVSNGSGATPTTNGAGGSSGSHEPALPVATSPAVGVFHPGPRAAAGTRIRSGDTLGSVDVLGVPQEVVSPVDGIVGETLVEAGTAVEYGQELVQIELATSAEAR
jgi:acetyl-CoA carboxylase biotin carboxyl carrier protein